MSDEIYLRSSATIDKFKYLKHPDNSMVNDPAVILSLTFYRTRTAQFLMFYGKCWTMPKTDHRTQDLTKL